MGDDVHANCNVHPYDKAATVLVSGFHRGMEATCWDLLLFSREVVHMTLLLVCTAIPVKGQSRQTRVYMIRNFRLITDQ